MWAILVLGPMRYEDFASNVRAHLRYTYALPPEEALETLRRRFDDGTWREVANEWLMSVGAVTNRHGVANDSRVTALRASLVAALVTGPVDRTAHETLLPLFCQPIAATPDEAERLVAWFVSHAEPGDASLAADVLMSACSDSDSRPAMRPLATWLVTNGAAELRARRRFSLVLCLVQMFEGPNDRALLAATLRYLVRTEEDWSLGRFVHEPHTLLGSAERLLEDPGSASLALDMVARLGCVASLLAPPAEWPSYPRLVTAVYEGLARGAWPRTLAMQAWRAAFDHEPAASLTFTSADAIDIAVAALADRRMFPKAGALAHATKHAAAWTQLLASEYLRIHGVDTRSAHRLATLMGPAVDFARGVGLALRDHLEGPSLERSLVDEGLTPGHVAAALASVQDPLPRATATSRATEDPDLLRTLTRLLHHPWLEPVFGVDVAALVQGATRVALANLGHDDKIAITDGVALVDRATVESMLRSVDLDREGNHALTALYFLHELIHLAQGIGDKRLVTALRATGSETTLLHLDLSADHAAALAVARAVPRWRVEWLKDLQGRSLVAFPVSPTNTSAGRARKAQRLVGLRVDYLARATGSISSARLGDGYAFADYGPAGGQILLLVSGPPMTLVTAAPLTQAEVQRLAGAADEGAALNGVDEVVRAGLLHT